MTQKLSEVGTHEVGHRSDFCAEISSVRAGNFLKIKCDLMLRLV